jgi:hypothetical protein
MKPELSWSERLWSHSVGWAGCGEVELGRGSMLVTYRGGSSLLALGAAKWCWLMAVCGNLKGRSSLLAFSAGSGLHVGTYRGGEVELAGAQELEVLKGQAGS